MITPIELILSKVEKVHQGQRGQWMTRCPAHKDKNPSLSIRERPDGSVALKCFAGCEFYEILKALGLEAHELYPPRKTTGNEPNKLAKPFTPLQGLIMLSDAAFLIMLLGCDVVKGKSISQEDLDSCLLAVNKIVSVRYEYMGSQF